MKPESIEKHKYSAVLTFIAKERPQMRMSLESRVVILTSAVVAGLVGWGFLRQPLSTSLLNMLNSDIRGFLLGPLFSIGKVPLSPLSLVKCIVFLILLSVFSRVFQSLLAKKILTHTSMDRGHQYAFVRASGYIVFATGLIIGLDTTGINLRSLLVLGGALGLGIGLGLQSIVADFVAGIVILWEGPIKLGDFIDLGNISGSTELTVTHGEVIRIGARGTWVRTFDNEVMIVPNSEFINNRVANMSADDRSVRLTIPIDISYDSDLEVVRAALLDIAKRNEYVLQDPAPAVMVNGFGDSSVNISLRVSTARMTDRTFMLKSDLFMEIFRVFREKKMGLPFPITNQLGTGEKATSAA